MKGELRRDIPGRLENCDSPAAAEANEPAALRVAVKGWERALIETLEATRTRPGAA